MHSEFNNNWHISKVKQPMFTGAKYQ